MKKLRFVDGGVEHGITEYDVMDEFLVVCLRCKSCATIRKS